MIEARYNQDLRMLEDSSNFIIHVCKFVTPEIGGNRLLSAYFAGDKMSLIEYPFTWYEGDCVGNSVREKFEHAVKMAKEVLNLPTNAVFYSYEDNVRMKYEERIRVWKRNHLSFCDVCGKVIETLPERLRKLVEECPDDEGLGMRYIEYNFDNKKSFTLFVVPPVLLNEGEITLNVKGEEMSVGKPVISYEEVAASILIGESHFAVVLIISFGGGDEFQLPLCCLPCGDDPVQGAFEWCKEHCIFELIDERDLVRVENPLDEPEKWRYANKD